MQFARWPSGVFQSGAEGNWSTFPLSAGTPRQYFNVLVSTTSPYLTLPFPDFCAQNPTPRCGLRHGALGLPGQPSNGFSIPQSSSWIATTKTDIAGMGWDVLAYNTTARVRVEAAPPESQFVGTIGLRALPQLGFLGPSYASQMGSFLQTALAGRLVSRSFAYTAGAAYRNADASLLFGGFDLSRVGQNAHSFPFSSDPARPLMARLTAITLLSGLRSGAQVSLPQSSTPVLLDSTSPYLELPKATCKDLERAFDLEFEPQSGQFRVNASTRRQLHEQNPKLRFKLTEESKADGSVEVELPYASFDLTTGSTLDHSEGAATYSYFPIKLIADNQPSVLGRAFFQEAYLIVDYEHANFTLAQCAFPPSSAVVPDATIIEWNLGHGTSRGLTAAFLFLVLTIILVFILLLRQLPITLMHHVFEKPRARRLKRREQQLERLWKEIHTPRPPRDISTSLSSERDDDHSQVLNQTFPRGSDHPDLADEENISSPQAIAKARAGKKRATPLQI